MPDLYAVLGVNRSADATVIKSAYRRLARQYHPDVNPDPMAANKFALLNEAYHVLSDPARRTWYDRTGSTDGINLISKNTQTSVAAMRAARRAYYQARADRIVNEWLERERIETRARGKAVYTTVTLFLSTFIIALTKPNLLDTAGLFWRVALVILFAAGVWHLVTSLKQHFDYYTYRPTRRSSAHPKERPRFKRSVAWTFVLGGWLVSFGAGVLIDSLTNVSMELFGMTTLNDALLGVILFPPIAVLIVDTMYRINLRFEDL
jgi:protein-S-isoprenylcysteine O-methyltransferase Ste14